MTQSPFSMITASAIPDRREWGFIGDVHTDGDEVRETTVKAGERRGVSSSHINQLDKFVFLFLVGFLIHACYWSYL